MTPKASKYPTKGKEIIFMKEKYNDGNVFAKIIRGEIPSKKVFEDEDLLCFYDANPVAKVHVLVIPKGKYIDYDDFATNAPAELVLKFFTTIPKIAEKLNIKEYRLVSNCGKSAGQIVFHFHVHIISNEIG